MSNWYYLKHRKPVPYGCDIISDQAKYTKIYNKQYHGKNKYARFIRRKFIGDYTISTIFLGLDHQLGLNDDKPILFETMVFKGSSMMDLLCDRCSTHRQALKQHQKAIEWVKSK